MLRRFASTTLRPSGLFRSPVAPLVAVGAGAWLGADEERPARIRGHLEASVRAARLVGCCAHIAWDYRQGKRWAQQVQEYACLYTSHVTNLVQFAPDTSFRALSDLMPHDRAPPA